MRNLFENEEVKIPVITRAFYVVILLFIAQPGISQNLIPRIGLSLARTSRSGSDSEYHYKSEKLKPGILIGLGYDVPLSETLNFYSEICFIQKGLRSSEVGKNPDHIYINNRNYSLNFLEVPVLLKAQIDRNKIKLFPLAGVTLSYGLGGRLEPYYKIGSPNNFSLATENFDVVFESRQDFMRDGKAYVGRPFDVGIQAGVGIQVFKKVIFDVRYTYGLIGFEYFENDSDKNRVLQFSISTPIAARVKE